MAKGKNCPDCGGEPKGRGFAHKPGCKRVSKKAGTGKRLAALEGRLSFEEKAKAKELAKAHTADVLRYALTFAKVPPKKVSTETLWAALEQAKLDSTQIAKVKAALTAG